MPKIKVSIYTVILLLLSLIGGFFYQLLTIFIVIFIHEFGHVIAAKCFKLKITHLSIYPFGIFLTIDDLHKLKTYKSILLYLSGVSFQCLFLSIMYVMRIPISTTFLIINLFIININLLPIAPLDGYNVLLHFLQYFLSYQKTVKILLFIALSILFLLLLMFTLNFNLNYFIIVSYLIYYNLKLYFDRDLIQLSKIVSKYLK